MRGSRLSSGGIARTLWLYGSRIRTTLRHICRCACRAGAREGFGHDKGLPLVKAPRGFEPVWEDSSSYNDVRLVLWRPIPYPG